MKIAELEINIMAVPQGYYLAQGISRDLNFKVGLPAEFEKTYNLKEKLTDKYDEIECGETYLIDNVYSLVVKDSSYDSPDRDLLMEALVNLRDQMEENKVTKLAIPRLCCGRGGLDWDDMVILSRLNMVVLVQVASTPPIQCHSGIRSTMRKLKKDMWIRHILYRI